MKKPSILTVRCMSNTNYHPKLLVVTESEPSLNERTTVSLVVTESKPPLLETTAISFVVTESKLSLHFRTDQQSPRSLPYPDWRVVVDQLLTDRSTGQRTYRQRLRLPGASGGQQTNMRQTKFSSNMSHVPFLKS